MARLPTNETPAQQRKRIDSQWMAAIKRERKDHDRTVEVASATLVAVSLLAALVLLSGCGTTRPVVAVPTPVLCKVTLPAEPDFAFDSLPEGSDIFTQAKTLLADRRQRIDYERQLRAAGEACS